VASTRPYIGTHSIFWDYREYLDASSSASGAEVELLADYQPGTFWAPAQSAWTAGDVCVYAYPADNQLLPLNWFFRDWSAGAAAAPDGWTLVEGAVAQSGDAKVGAASCGVTRSGVDAVVSQGSIPATVGLQYSAGAWVKADDVDQARIVLTDGSTSWASAYHTGDSEWEWLDVSSVAVASTSLTLRLEVNDTDGTAIFDGALVVMGSSADETPHAVACDYLALAAHNLGTAGVTVDVEHSTDQTTWTSAVDEEIDTDEAVWVDFTSVKKAYWRVKLSRTGTYSCLPRIGVLSLGKRLTLPQFCGSQAEHLHVAPTFDLSATAYGSPLGRAARMNRKRFTIRQQYISRTDLAGDLESLRLHGFGEGLPFFVAPDFGSYPEEVYFCWVPDGAEWNPILVVGGLVRELSIRIEALA
jgi:hypothetical protein